MVKNFCLIVFLILSVNSAAQQLKPTDSLNQDMDEVVITGSMKEMSRKESSIPVEVYTSKFFKKNPTPNLFEAVGMVNGVKPQLNCNVCNTRDLQYYWGSHLIRKL